MSAPRRVTQEDVARAADVNRATVSLALRNDRSIPRSTCERIQTLATRMGYSPDPLLSALARYRTTIRPATYHGTIAWLAHTTNMFQWREIPHFKAYLAAAEKHCLNHGYELTVIDLGKQKLSWDRAASLALARGIHGLLLCPQPDADTDLRSFPWQRFSAVTFGYSLTKPALHSVAAAHYRAMLLTFEKMKTHGARRIGFMAQAAHDLRINHNLLAGFLASQHTSPELKKVEPFFCDDWDDTAIPRWIAAQKLDGLITCDVHFLQRSYSKKIPKRVAVAVPMLSSEDTGLAGVWESNEKIAEAAVDFLVGMIQRRETGVPALPQRLLIEGAWIDGQTMPKT